MTLCVVSFVLCKCGLIRWFAEAIRSVPKWSELVRNDQKWPEVIRSDPKWSEVISSDLKWSEMIRSDHQNGQKWSSEWSEWWPLSTCEPPSVITLFVSSESCFVKLIFFSSLACFFRAVTLFLLIHMVFIHSILGCFSCTENSTNIYKFTYLHICIHSRYIGLKDGIRRVFS